MVGLLHLFKPKVPGLEPMDKLTHHFSNGMGYGSLVLIVLILIVVTKQIFTSKENLKSNLYKERFGFLYDNLKAEAPKALFYNLLFSCRRISMCILYLFL